MILRDACPADAAAIAAIYGHHVTTGTGTFDEVPPDAADVAARIAHIQGRGWAWLVALDEKVGDEGSDDLLGYGFFAQYRDRSAYRFTAEDSVYVRPDVNGQGVGKALAAALLARAEAAGFRQMIAVIGDSENVGSIGLHVSLGFRHAGTLKAAGYKFGRWVDVVNMQKSLGEGDRSLPPA